MNSTVQRSTPSQRLSNGHQNTYLALESIKKHIMNGPLVSLHEMNYKNDTFRENEIPNGKTATQRWNTVVPTADFSLGICLRALLIE